jgi:hypothetical protein
MVLVLFLIGRWRRRRWWGRRSVALNVVYYYWVGHDADFTTTVSRRLNRRGLAKGLKSGRSIGCGRVSVVRSKWDCVGVWESSKVKPKLETSDITPVTNTEYLYLTELTNRPDHVQ